MIIHYYWLFVYTHVLFWSRWSAVFKMGCKLNNINNKYSILFLLGITFIPYVNFIFSLFVLVQVLFFDIINILKK